MERVMDTQSHGDLVPSKKIKQHNNNDTHRRGEGGGMGKKNPTFSPLVANREKEIGTR